MDGRKRGTADNSGKNGNSGRNGKKQPADRAAMILHLLRSTPEKKFTLKAIAAASGGADPQGRRKTYEILSDLVAQGIAESFDNTKFRLSQAHLPRYTGIVDMLSSGSMFVKVDELEDDIFIDARNGQNVLNGDKVEVIITYRKRNGRPEGEITRVLERNRRNYVGVSDVTEHAVFVKPDSRKIPVDIYIRNRNGFDLTSGQKVAFKITDWPAGSKSPTGEIVEVLGEAGDNDTEMHAIMSEFELPYYFETRIEEAAENIPDGVTGEECARRRDFRDIVTFTIDPEDAKDFDDALSIREIGNGVWEIGVHIADVTHYVKPGDIVDTEAEERATSVYLVDRTIPMLPERLSNELCSLRPDEEKLCFSAVFEMGEDLAIHRQWFGRTVILSNRRFTYEEAQNIIETGEGDYRDEVLKLNELARKLRERRFARGSISFEREEFKFRLDENGRPLSVYPKEMKDSNHLIEEFMLLANKKVAEFVGKNPETGRKSNKTFVYRVHDKPDEDKLLKFSDFVIRFGYYFRPDRLKDVSKQMNRLMDKIKGRSEENVISTLAIRTMAKAYYSTDNIGHYGLAFPYYTHFTSPIRRYPDIMVHRLLAHYLDNVKSEGKARYEKLCEHSSEMEVRAADAERASVKYKMAEFMLERMGQEFDGHITGISDWGIYVELDKSLIEGMVSIRDVTDDFYRFDENIYAAVGQSSGRKFTLGDSVRVKVKGVDLARRQIDFLLMATIDFETGRVDPLPEPVRKYPERRQSDRRERSGKKRRR